MKNGVQNPGAWNLPAWSRIGAFEVLGDYTPMPGFRLLVAVGPTQASLTDVLEQRAIDNPWLDPDLARATMRAGLGLLRSNVAEFVYANPEQTLVLVPAQRASAETIMDLSAQLVSGYASRLSLLCGREMCLQSRVFELPDATVVRRALGSLVEDVEDNTPLRSSLWLGAQLRGRGQAFHPSMVESLEEQNSLLRGHGIDMDALPAWWWRGVAAHVDVQGGLRVYDDLPHGEAFGELVPE